jgi:hypothetical protein
MPEYNREDGMDPLSPTAADVAGLVQKKKKKTQNSLCSITFKNALKAQVSFRR